jgi:hypothetical protein
LLPLTKVWARLPGHGKSNTYRGKVLMAVLRQLYLDVGVAMFGNVWVLALGFVVWLLDSNTGN